MSDCSRASDRQQRTLGRQQSDGECAARRAAAKTPTADVAVTQYPPSDEGRRRGETVQYRDICVAGILQYRMCPLQT